MPEYIVTRKSDGAEMIRYSSSQVVEQINDQAYPQAEFDHAEWTPDAPTVAPAVKTWSQTEWKRRFTQGERLAIRDAAKQNAILADYMDLMNGAEVIANNDPDTIAAVNMLEQAGLIAEGRANEVLNG